MLEKPMARYTGLFVVTAPFEHLRQLLTDVLMSCNLDIIYDRKEYLMAREIPGQVSFSQLVTIEVAIDVPDNSFEDIRMKFVVKNEELPLRRNNHCYQMFQTLNKAISDYQYWQLREAIAG
jgi:hypothetical protein